jgi:hypothetical protein
MKSIGRHFALSPVGRPAKTSIASKLVPDELHKRLRRTSTWPAGADRPVDGDQAF